VGRSGGDGEFDKIAGTFRNIACGTIPAQWTVRLGGWYFPAVMSRTDVPEYFVYGEPARAIDVGFVHVERVRDRNNVHLGHVAPHKHGRMSQLTFWTSGTGTYHIEDRQWAFTAPAASFVPSSVVHGFDIDSNADAIVVSVADDLVGDLEGRTGLRLDLPRFVLGSALHDWTRLAMILDAVLDESQGGQVAGDQVVTTLVASALAYLARLDTSSTLLSSTLGVSLALALRRLVDQHYRENWSSQRLAEELGTTPHLLNKASRAVLGMSVKDLMVQRRLLEAKRLLLFTIRSVEDIAYEIGFADPAYFSRFFRLHCGDAPAHWRETHGGH
jgi:AraC family transcriptional activator of pobA